MKLISKIKGVWCYLYRAIDKSGDTIDFMLSKNRDEVAARTFFERPSVQMCYLEKPR